MRIWADKLRPREPPCQCRHGMIAAPMKPNELCGDQGFTGAGSVTKDIPGNPCRVHRQLKPPLTDPRSVKTTWA
jgi:hypothetical protein